MNGLTAAIVMAARAHEGITDKGGLPSILHPLRVMLACRNKSEDTMIVAVLHDVVEDCGITLAVIESCFGRDVRDGVDAVSRRINRDGTKEVYRDFLARAMQNPIGHTVKIQDVADNAARLAELTGKVDECEIAFLRKRYATAMEILSPTGGR